MKFAKLKEPFHVKGKASAALTVKKADATESVLVKFACHFSNFLYLFSVDSI